MAFIPSDEEESESESSSEMNKIETVRVNTLKHAVGTSAHVFMSCTITWSIFSKNIVVFGDFSKTVRVIAQNYGNVVNI